jgi:hypothetical protein
MRSSCRGPANRPTSPASASASAIRRGSGGNRRRLAVSRRSRSPGRSEASSSSRSTVPPDVVAQPRHRPELERVGRLVHGDPPQHQLAARPAEPPVRLGQVGRHEQQSRRARGPDERDVVLTEDAAREVAQGDARLDAGHRPRRRSRERPERARDMERRGEPSIELHGGVANRGEVGAQPLGAADELGAGKLSGRVELRVRADQPDCVRRRGVDLALRDPILLRPVPRDHDPHALRETPIDQPRPVLAGAHRRPGPP